MTVSWSVQNAGVGSAKGPWIDRVFFSTDGTLTNATLLGSAQRFADLAAGGSGMRPPNARPRVLAGLIPAVPLSPPLRATTAASRR